MFTINDDLSIYVTRGDIVHINLSLESEGEPREFKAGDIVRFKVFGKKDCANVVLEKDFPVVSNSATVEMFLSEAETKIGGVINKHTDYWYEVELNPDTKAQTIIGYDEEGPKIFRLFPEGRNASTDNPDVTPEDVSIMDAELDLTSRRPVENQAITRAISRLEASTNELEITVQDNKQEFNNFSDYCGRAIVAFREDLNQLESDNTEKHEQVDQQLSDITDSFSNLNKNHNELAESHDELEQNHNELVENHNELAESYSALEQSHNELVENHNELFEEHKELTRNCNAADEQIYNLGLQVYHRKKTLWEGTWSEGAVRIPEAANYMLFRIDLSGKNTSILAVRNGLFVRGIGGFSSATPTVTTYHFAAEITKAGWLEGDVWNGEGFEWTLIACNQGDHFKDNVDFAECTITKIVGII